MNSQSADRLSAIVATDATKLAIASNLSDLNNAGTARTNLGLAIGTDISAITSPAFTGSPTAPTQSAGDDSTKIATTAYVDTAVTGVSSGGSKPTITTLGSQGANYTITSSSGIEEVFLITPTSSIDVVLEAAATCGAGYKYQIKNLASSYNLTLKGSGSETIDSVAPSTGISIDAQFEAVTVMTDGSNWFII